jgi:hypothetical protein
MTKLRVIWLVVALIVVRTAWAQSDIQVLEKTLKGKRMALRSYSADPVPQYAWANGAVEAGPVKVHTVAILTLESVRMKGGQNRAGETSEYVESHSAARLNGIDR